MNNTHVTIETCMDKVANAREWLIPRLEQQYPWTKLTTLPTKLDGSFYSGTNILLLWMQQDELQTNGAIWGSAQSFARAGKPVRSGESPRTAVFFTFADPFGDGNLDSLQHQNGGRIRELKPIELFNLAQTEDYQDRPTHNNQSGSPPATFVDKFWRFSEQFFEKWKAIPANKKRLLNSDEEAFLARYASDIFTVLSGTDAGHIRDNYTLQSISAIVNADAGKLMKLAGIAQEMVTTFTKTEGASAAGKDRNTNQKMDARAFLELGHSPAPAPRKVKTLQPKALPEASATFQSRAADFLAMV